MPYPRSLLIRRFVLVAIALVFVPPPGRTAPMDGPLEPDLLGEARKARDRGDWVEASVWYERAYRQDRKQVEARNGYLLSIRQMLRKDRRDDPLYRTTLLSPEYRLTHAMEFYRNVVSKLQIFYLEQRKTQVNRLFHEGLEEICLDLEDKEFRDAYFFEQPMNQVDAEDLAQSLRKEWARREVHTLEDALGEIAQVARRLARFPRGAKTIAMRPNYLKVLIVEFACGACNSQDEYTCYLSPSYPSGLMMENTVSSWIAEKGVGRIRITGFDGMTFLNAQAALERLLKEEKVEVIILDLRGNGGGSFEEAVRVAELFLARGVMIAETTSNPITREDGQRTFPSRNAQPSTVPLVVQVDGGTASAAELLAGALKVNGRAEIIGRATFGKNLIQQTLPVSQAPYGVMHVTWARFSLYQTPDIATSGGIAPTYPADDNDDVALKRARALVMR